MYELAFIRIQFAIHYKSTIFGTDHFDSFGVINILLQKWLVLLQRKSKIRIFIFPIRSSYKIIQSLILNHWNAESSRKTRSIYYACMPEYGFFLQFIPYIFFVMSITLIHGMFKPNQDFELKIPYTAKIPEITRFARIKLKNKSTIENYRKTFDR